MSELKIIARVRTPFKSKFGIPRQSGVVEELKGEIVFEPEFRDPEAVRGIEQWSHLWLIWQFSENIRDGWSPTVRPPRLGGNTRVGVFATRSPFRPNALGLSCVRLESVDITQDGPVIHICGADLLDGTPVFDIKPYVPYADAHPEASGGFTDTTGFHTLEVNITQALEDRIPEGERAALRGVLSQDPRPPYHRDPERVYGLEFGECEVRFKVDGDTLTVVDILI